MPYVWLRWFDIDIVPLFLRFYGPRLGPGPLKRKKRTLLISSHLDLTLGQYRIYIKSANFQSLEPGLKKDTVESR